MSAATIADLFARHHAAYRSPEETYVSARHTAWAVIRPVLRRTLATTAPKMNPPTWAKNATPLAAGALASAALGLSSTANAAPSALSSAKSTVSQLKSQGYHVVVNRVGTAPLDQCTIRSGTAGAKGTRAPTRELPAPTTMSSPP